MYRNLAYGNNEKISKVIELAVSYKNHRKSIQKIKPAINMPSLSTIKKSDQLTTNRIKYTKQSRDFKNTFIQRDNTANDKRLSRAESVFKKIRNPQMTLSPSRVNQSRLSKSKSKSRLSSRNQLHSCDSQRSISSNYMTRTKRYKEIEEENKKIAQRIQHPKTNKNMKFKVYDKEYQKQQEYVRIRSRFSQRSKSIMQSLMLDGLKMDRKNLQFLPQINSPRKGMQNGAISISRTGLIEERERQQSHNRQKTLQFAKSMRRQIKKSRYSKH